MPKSGCVSNIFKKKPEQWGLRGDPYFWDLLEEYYKEKELPYSGERMEEDINNLFQEITGEQLYLEGQPFVERFARGGMSSGHLSGRFWIEEGIPLLVRRLKQVNINFPDT